MKRRMTESTWELVFYNDEEGGGWLVKSTSELGVGYMAPSLFASLKGITVEELFEQAGLREPER